MKDFKVRIWNGKEQVMIYPGECFEWTISLCGEIFRGTSPSIKDKENCEIMLFSGMRDINGTDIYEGDIVSTFCRDSDSYATINGKSTIVFSNGGFCFRAGPDRLQFDLFRENIKAFKIQVIDNIYEKNKRKKSKQ